MRFIRLGLLFAALAFALIACNLSGGDAATQISDNLNTEDAALPTTPPDTGALDFSITLTGGLEHVMTPGEATSIFIPAQDIPADDQGNPAMSLPATVQVTFQQGALEDDYTVMLFISPEITNGTYTIGSAGDDAPVYAEVSRIAPVEGGLSARVFNQNVNGTLTLTETGDQISGSLSFTADGQDGSTTVTGTFSNVPFNRSS